eukprot:1953123-Pyramimonas_sp.AAC.2
MGEPPQTFRKRQPYTAGRVVGHAPLLGQPRADALSEPRWGTLALGECAPQERQKGLLLPASLAACRGTLVAALCRGTMAAGPLIDVGRVRRGRERGGCQMHTPEDLPRSLEPRRHRNSYPWHVYSYSHFVPPS